MQKKKMKTTTQIYSYHRTLTEIICDAALRRRIAGINNKPVKTYTIYFRRRAKETLLTDISTSLQQDYVSVRIGLSSLTTTFNTTTLLNGLIKHILLQHGTLFTETMQRLLTY